MSQSTAKRQPAAARKAAAARAEKTNKPRTVEWRGLKLTLPAVLAGTLYFDFAELGEDSENPAVQVRLLTSLIGADQVTLVRAKIAEDAVPFDQVEETLLGLFDAVFGSYGLAAGESSASAES